MKNLLLILLLLIPLSNLVAQDLSDEKAISIIKKAVEKAPKEIYSVSMSDILKEFTIEEVNIIKRGKFNNEKKYWPVRATVKGKDLLILWGNSNPIWAKKDTDNFSKIVDARLKVNDFDEWEVDISKVKKIIEENNDKNKNVAVSKLRAIKAIRKASSFYDKNKKITKDEIEEIIITYGSLAFEKHCSTCHQKNGAGIIGKYPNIADDDWLWGGGVSRNKNNY